MTTKQQTNVTRKLLCATVATLLALAIFAFVIPQFTPSKPKPQIITQSFLKEVVNTSNLSTFEAVYNGIAKGTNKDKPEQVDYYVSYEAKIKAGFDFDQVQIEVNEEEKFITVLIPKVKITTIEIDITSLDYIFENDKANTETISQEAYKTCIEDATEEGNTQKEIFRLAAQNAKNVIEALIKPFVEQLDTEYTLNIHTEE